jgi:predicted SAM-dependent methyltransferase
MPLRHAVKEFLHEELFLLEPPAKQAFRYASADDHLRQIFAQNGHPLGSDLRFLSRNSRKWKLMDGKTTYLVKDLGDYLLVIREKNPLVCSFLENVIYKIKPGFHAFRWRLRQRCLQQTWILKKRWVDRSDKLLVNLGAGPWYVPNWKVLDCQGEWYRYPRSLIDFHHDLTSMHPLPFADNSVHLFYSEHVLEHFKDEWCMNIIQEAHRCLVNGGGFRIVVPDADLIYDRLKKQDVAFFKNWMDRDNASLAESFRTLAGHSRSALDEEEFASRLAAMPKEAFLDWCKEGLEYDWKRAGEHINWLNFEKLSRMLKRAGFRQILRSEAQQSRFPDVRGSRFDTRPWYSVHVDCLK